MSDSLVSVIMPAYNCEKFISGAIDSVLNQSYECFELLICDDGSTDNTVSLIRKYAASDTRVRMLNNRFHKGAAGARNSCLELSSGKYIAFLDADDAWLESKLKMQIDFMKFENLAFSYTFYHNMTETGDIKSLVKSPLSMNLTKMRYANFIGCLTVMIDRDKWQSSYQPNIKKRNDYAFWLEIFRKNPSLSAKCLPMPLALYRVNTYGLSSNILDSIKFFFKCVNEFGGANRVMSLFYTVCYLTLTLLKKKNPDGYNNFVTKL